MVRERRATGLPEGTHVARVSLRVSSLDRLLAFYEGLLGLRSVARHDGVCLLGNAPGGPAMLTLIEDLSAGIRATPSAGLYHVAFRFGSRGSLARALRRLLDNAYPVQGAADHGVSEAIYLDDPEGNGVEIYVDRPRERWPWTGDQVRMVTGELDIDSLWDEARNKPLPPDVPAPVGVGHVHLQVKSLARSSLFYHDVLGFDITQSSIPGALFFSTGGYHHHIGVNIWGSGNRMEMPESGRGLAGFRIDIPDRPDLEALVERLEGQGVPFERSHGGDAGVRVLDPDRIPIELVTGRGSA